jgi:galactose mutarotase-like enzyme
MSLDITSSRLNFTVDKNDVDPNNLVSFRTAHCVGYANFFTTTCNYLLQKNDLADTWEVKTEIGQLYLFGVNVHSYLNSPFLKDHDFVSIENQETGEVLAVDPSVHDYLGISLISYQK